ncbi:Alpha/Beta hydrolase protein [Trametes polyzona]|nr:Alpha/Beta hydrolase protein [Trametes polyzona]
MPAPEPTRQSLVIAGLNVNVYSQRNATSPDKPVVIMFLLHGRNGTAHRMLEFVQGIFEEVYTHRESCRGRGPEAHDLYIVTFDHRNHGKRLVDKKANQGWFDDPEQDNPRHAIDMYSIQTGTAHDVSYLVDFLPPYLFPNEERTISQFVCVGKSLGGHSTWLVLRNEPRIKIGVPIIASPDYLALMSRRARSHKLPVGPPYFPKSLLDLIARADPVAAPYTAADASNPFLGKKILVLSGQDDKKVPWATAAKTFVENLNVGEGGVKEVIIESGVGHLFSPAMVKECARFVWEHALAV